VGFEVLPRGERTFAERLPEGACSLSKNGKLTLRKGDLALARISEAAIVLADPGTLRIALRAPRPDEAALAMRVGLMGKKNQKDPRYGVSVARAVKAVGLTLAAAAGRYELATKGTGADALLIVKLVVGDAARPQHAAKEAVR
jgi:hypothetical protein